MSEQIRVMIGEAETDKRIRELGAKISADYAGKEIHMICVLKGGVFFMCELAKRLPFLYRWTSCPYPVMGTILNPAALLKLQKTWISPWKEKTYWLWKILLIQGER